MLSGALILRFREIFLLKRFAQCILSVLRINNMCERNYFLVVAHIFICERYKIIMIFKECKNCKRKMIIHGKDLCVTCYKKLCWTQKEDICRRCQRKIKIHAKGLCPGCYNFVFHIENNRAQNYKKNFQIEHELYKKKTAKCILCGFDKIVDLHHLDENKKNNSEKNLIGLCPNHHKMIHMFKFRKEMRNSLEKIGLKISKDPKLDFEEKN